MAIQQGNVVVMGATVVTLAALGASVWPTKIVPPPNCIGFNMKALTGASTGILANCISGATLSGATALGTSLTAGYHLPIGTDIAIQGPACFWLASNGAATVSFNFWFGSAVGVTLA